MTTSPELTEQLYTCAFCPNTCRPWYAADETVQIESQTPSALSLLALAVLEKKIPYDTDTQAVLGRGKAAEASRSHCTYGLDIPALLDQALSRIKG